MSKHELSNNAADGPDVNSCCVVRVSKYQFWGSVVSGADIRYVRLSLHKLLGTTKIAELENVRLRITQNILRLDISVANSFGVNIRN